MQKETLHLSFCTAGHKKSDYCCFVLCFDFPTTFIAALLSCSCAGKSRDFCNRNKILLGRILGPALKLHHLYFTGTPMGCSKGEEWGMMQRVGNKKSEGAVEENITGETRTNLLTLRNIKRCAHSHLPV